MTLLRNVLIDARKHFLKGEVEQALTCLHWFDDQVHIGQIPKDDLAACADLLGEIRLLAEAAREGTAMAQRQVREILSFARGVNTYDVRGRKLDCPASLGREHRY